MKATYLVTLSARIEELTKYIGLILDGMKDALSVNNGLDPVNWKESFKAANDWKDFLKQPVTLSQFVPCKNGVPLEQPLPFRCGEETQKQCSQELEPCECAALDTQYNEAQKSVIFEGWEVHFVDFYGNTRIKRIDNEFSIDFSKDNTECRVFFNIKSNKRIKSLADLAEATQLNPIKLK